MLEETREVRIRRCGIVREGGNVCVGREKDRKGEGEGEEEREVKECVSELRWEKGLETNMII